ncbi:unnamed protein product [Dovyalis caffra]|uniref:DUF7722 domain-containing protein n=1 Tax=Dovyalis caffra TaxID=77055 RepID=A0AAV1QSP2_9ROSI|nr:unnamed protein product [Dovyalis caffra]
MATSKLVVFGHTRNLRVHHCDVIARPNGQGHVQECLKSLKDANESLTGIGILTREECPNVFQMPLHYPRYTIADYKKMEEWKLDMLPSEYGLCFKGTLDEKRAFRMGAFMWPDHL